MKARSQIEFIVAANSHMVYVIKKGEQVWKTGHSCHDVFSNPECKNRIGLIPGNSEIVITSLSTLPCGTVVGKLASQTIHLLGLATKDVYVVVSDSLNRESGFLSLVYK